MINRWLNGEFQTAHIITTMDYLKCWYGLYRDNIMKPLLKIKKKKNQLDLITEVDQRGQITYTIITVCFRYKLFSEDIIGGIVSSPRIIKYCTNNDCTYE